MSFSLGNRSIPTLFDQRKTAAAAAFLLDAAGGRVEYIRLLKLLYLADREAWNCFGRPITGDNYVSMDQGPVLSRTYDLIKNEGTDDEATSARRPWDQAIERADRYNVKLRSAVDLGPLSEAETDILGAVHNRWRRVPTWDLIELLHRELPEWTNPKGSCMEITPSDILTALGKGDEEVAAIAKDQLEQCNSDNAIGVH